MREILFRGKVISRDSVIIFQRKNVVKLNMLGRQPNRVFKSNNFCPDCGQALDWSDK